MKNLSLLSRFAVLFLAVALSAGLFAQGNPPTFTKAFGAAHILLNGTTSLTFNISTTNIPLGTGTFTDTLPAGLIISTPNGLTGSCGGGTITAVAGSSSITLSGAYLNAGTSCSFSVNVTGTSAGTKNNVSGLLTHDGPSGGPASATLIVDAPSVPALSPASLAGLALMLAGLGWVLARRARQLNA